VTEEVFEDMKGMFNEPVHRGLGFFFCQDEIFFRSFCHLFDRTPSLRDLPINTTSGIFFRDFFALLNPYISGISMHLGLLLFPANSNSENPGW